MQSLWFQLPRPRLLGYVDLVTPGQAPSVNSNPKATSQRMQDPDGIRTFTVISDIFLTKEPTIFQLKSGEHLILSSFDPWEGGPLHQLQLKCNNTYK